jgi:hypothetical protein
VNELTRIATKGLPVLAGTFVEKLSKPSIIPEEEVARAPSTTTLEAPPAVELREDTATQQADDALRPLPLSAPAEVNAASSGDGSFVPKRYVAPKSLVTPLRSKGRTASTTELNYRSPRIPAMAKPSLAWRGLVASISLRGSVAKQMCGPSAIARFTQPTSWACPIPRVLMVKPCPATGS